MKVLKGSNLTSQFPGGSISKLSYKSAIEQNEQLYKTLSWVVFMLSVIPVVSFIVAIFLGQKDTLGNNRLVEIIVWVGSRIGIASPLVLLVTSIVSKKIKNPSRSYKILLFLALIMSVIGTTTIFVFLGLLVSTGELRSILK